LVVVKETDFDGDDGMGDSFGVYLGGKCWEWFDREGCSLG
jgi:hypothetical protein